MQLVFKQRQLQHSLQTTSSAAQPARLLQNEATLLTLVE